MLKWKVNRTIDLTRDAPAVERLKALATLSTRIAHELRIGVQESKKDADLSGLTAKLSVILPDQSSLMDAFDGKIDGNAAVMTLPDICYSQTGEVRGVLYLADDDGGLLPIYAFVLLNFADLTDIFIDTANVVPSISELLAQMQTMREVTAAAQTATRNANTAAANADNKAAAADTAAKKLSDIDVEVTMLENGSMPSGSVAQTENSTTFRLKIPIGPQGVAGTNGQTPYIGSNGNWWIGNTDTGVKAQGPAGENGTGSGTVTAVTVSGEKYEPDSTGNVDLGDLGGGDVQMVCGVSPDNEGNVQLDAQDVGALASDPREEEETDPEFSGVPINADQLGGFSLDEIMLKLYPVGAIYTSTVETSPAQLFGGTWERLLGKFLFGADDNISAGSKGGEATHTLTLEEMPAHRHTSRVQWNKGTDADTVNTLAVGSAPVAVSNLAGYLSVDNGDQENIGINGGSIPHNNMPPYLAVYMWKRVG